ncbi:MAG: PAS domain S-box protein [Halarchaeum sp.]
MTDELTGEGPVAVLCVDRDAPDRTASRLAANGSFETTTATSVAAARDRLDDTPVDCVVTDTPLVDGDAFDLLAALRADHPRLPVILFPANGSEALASDAVGAGVADYVRDAGDDAAATLAARVRSAARARETSESAERARLLLEASPDAIVVSVDGTYVYANPAAVDLFDADGPGDVIGLRPTDVVHPDEREAVGDALERAAPGEHTVDQVHRRLRTLTGDTLDVEITGRATVWNGRRAVVAIIRDVTERVRLESDLREQNERLQRFASAVSHDIRTPVATAQGNLDVARDRRD